MQEQGGRLRSSLQKVSRLPLKVQIDGAVTISTGSLFQTLTTLSVKMLSRILDLLGPSWGPFKFKELPLYLLCNLNVSGCSNLMNTTPLKIFQDSIKSPLVLLFSKQISPNQAWGQLLSNVIYYNYNYIVFTVTITIQLHFQILSQSRTIIT